MEGEIIFDMSSLALVAARTEYAFLKQKLAMKRVAFEFEMARIKVQDAAYFEHLFGSQRKHSL